MKTIAAFVLSTVWYCVAVEAQRIPSPSHDVRIIGGVETTIEEFPFQLSVSYNGIHRCGATVLSEDWAVTAAHCVEGIPPASLSIRSGSSVSNSGGTEHNVDQIIIHERYVRKSPPYDYDVAVVKVSEKFVFGSSVRSIQMQSSGNQVPVATPVTTTGWGFAAMKAYPETLRKVTIEVIDHKQCEETYRKFAAVPPRLMCAGVHDGHKDTCGGDYGGPLVTGNPPVLVGISSWSYNCALDNYPGLYTDVSMFRDWIDRATGI